MNIKREPSDISRKRINYMVPPGKDPLNTKVLFDLSKLDGYIQDYKSVIQTFAAYRHETTRENGWTGLLLTSAEFC